MPRKCKPHATALLVTMSLGLQCRFHDKPVSGTIEIVLPASQIDAPLPNEAARRESPILLGLVVALMAYTLFVGWGLLTQRIAADSAYLWMALGCLIPFVWYGYGFVKVTEAEQDFGLLLSAVGWALGLVTLLLKHSAVQAALTRNDPAAANSTAATVCSILAVLCVLAGAALSLHGWSRQAADPDALDSAS